MKKITGYLLLFIIVAGFSGCKKSYDHYTLSDDFRSWLDFNRGSYWIYLNENSNKMDSASVWARNYMTSDAEKGNGYYFDYIDTRLKSQFLHIIYHRAFSDYESVMITTNEVNYPNAFRTNAAVNQKLSWESGIYEELEPYDTLNVNNRNFFNVRHTHTLSLIDGDSIVRDYFMVRHIGIIKFRQQNKSTDSVWTIVRWNVSQN